VVPATPGNGPSSVFAARAQASPPIPLPPSEVALRLRDRTVGRGANRPCANTATGRSYTTQRQDTLMENTFNLGRRRYQLVAPWGGA
jgi:hypothetical protein